MVLKHIKALTLRRPWEEDFWQLNSSVNQLNYETRETMSQDTFEQRALEGVDIWLLGDQITECQHQLCDVDSQHLLELEISL